MPCAGWATAAPQDAIVNSDTPPTALVTGASAGIGREIAVQLAARGYRLVLVARSIDALEALALEVRKLHGVHVRVLARDLASGAAARELADVLDDYDIRLDLLVNNAGAALGGFFRSQDTDEIEAMLELNMVASTVLLRRVLARMLERGSGRILNVASLAGYQAVPGMAAYAATKAYLLSLSEALSEELRGTGVSVTALCPGLTRTGLASQLTTRITAAERLEDLAAADPAEVAREGIEAVLRNEAVRVPGLFNRGASLWMQTHPRFLVRQLGGFWARALIED